MSDSIKKVSKKKMIFVQIDEEITSVFERISPLPYKEIYLVVPRRAVLLQSVVNLKILKQKLEEVEKTLAIITNDVNGMKLALQAQIKVFDEWNVDSDTPSNKEDRDPESALLKPIAATQNEVEDELPSRLPKKKSSIFDVVRHLKNKDKGFSLRKYMSDLKKNRLERQSIQLSPGKKRWVVTFLLASAVIFFIIIYVALPGATVAIEPSSDVVTKTVNVIFTPQPDDERSLKAYPVDTEVDVTITHSASGAENKGSNASGTITIVNKSGTERTLIATTRFQTQDGIVFRIQSDVTVPAGSESSPATVDVPVVADPLDANGSPVGVRGNIEPTTFFLPGLKEDSRSTLYGQSSVAMTGGTSDVVMHVTEEDLQAAQIELEEKLKEEALADLRKVVLQEGNTVGATLKLLEDSETLQFGTVSAVLPYDLVGQEKESFEVKGSLTLSGVAYDSEGLYSILKTEIVSVQTPGKQLISIDQDSISLEVLNVEVASNTYKVTAQIQGVEEYQIDPDLEGGAELSKKIKEHIAGKTIQEAEDYIQNLPEVNSVSVSVWPVWSPTIPSLPDNIKIKSLSEGEKIE
jgi:hypothetical protein